jgi:hypothetical protein
MASYQWLLAMSAIARKRRKIDHRQHESEGVIVWAFFSARAGIIDQPQSVAPKMEADFVPDTR